jgi:hypothetical protein
MASYNPDAPIVTEFGKAALLFGNNTFTQNKVVHGQLLDGEAVDTTYWTCRECPKGANVSVGRVTTRTSAFDGHDVQPPVLTKQHGPQCQQLTVVEIINQRARGQLLSYLRTTPLASKQGAYASMVADLQNPGKVPAAYLAQQGYHAFTSEVSLRSAAQRAAQHTTPPLPATMAELTGELLWEHAGRLTDGTPFLLSVADFEHSKIIVFGTENFLARLCAASAFYADGTWKVVPKLINLRQGQLFTLHIVEGGQICIPCIYAFLPSKNQRCYELLFQLLHQACEERGLALDPRYIVSDYESALLPAFAHAFPGAEPRGCYFHYGQAVYKTIGSSANLRNMYNNQADRSFRTFARMLIALAFLPAALVVPVYNQICALYAAQHPEEALHANGEVAEMLQYMERQWLGHTGIPISQWNVFLRDQEAVDRTNNAVEGFHNRLHLNMGDHPTMWKACACLVKEQEHYQLRVGQMEQHNQKVVEKDSRYVRLQATLVDLRADFVASGYAQPIPYVRAISLRIADAYWEK